MKIEFDIPSNLSLGDIQNVFTHLEAIHCIIGGKREQIIMPIVAENSCAITPEAKKSKQDGLPEMTKLEEDRDNEITKILKLCQGPADARTRLAKTCYKNLTKIYGIVWEQSAKDYKDRWNIDSDVKISKRRVVCGSEKLHRLYTNQLKTMVDHYNANVIFWATATN